MEETYDIYFSGQIIAGRPEPEVRQNLGRLFRTDGAALERLFSGTPVRVKRGVDQETAIRYRVAFREAGALVEIRPSGESGGQSPRTAPSPGLSLLPPRSGSLADCAPAVTPVPLPDISGLALAPPGAPLDDATPPPPADIDTTGLTLFPPASGSLEECAPTVVPLPLPDISDLKLDDS
ncbi:MAG TPA: hypothetical protein ENK50_04775 [Sedimenticola sp.]|nr:hypothetical protein [Sedimenticola sp.]